jgi:hypothetical protein
MYELTTFGSVSESGTTRFTVIASTTASQVVNTYGNTTVWTTFSGLKPDANGKISVQVNLLAGSRGPLNVLDLAVYNVGGAGGVGSAGPADLASGSPASGSGGTAAAASAVIPTKTVPAKTTNANNAGDTASVVVPTKTTAAAFSVQVNFQPASVSAPKGYIVDSGLPFSAAGNGYTYGWTTDLSSFAVQRNSASRPDIRYDTAIMLVAGGTWEMAVPNGMYDVKIVAGAGGSNGSGTLTAGKFSVEGVPMTSTQTATPAPAISAGWSEESITVVVTDGRLTITASPGSSICFVQITGR